MTLFRIFSFGSAVFAARLILQFGVQKIIAIHFGPSGIALAGQIQSLIDTIASFGANGLRSAAVKFSAEYARKDDAVWQAYLGNIAVLGVTTTIAVIMVLGIFAGPLALLVLGTEEFTTAWLCLIVAAPVIAAGRICSGALNGIGRPKTFLLIELGTSLGALTMVLLLGLWAGLEGALAGLIVAHIISNPFGVLAFSRRIGLKMLRFRVDKVVIKRIVRYPVTNMASGLIIPVTYIAVRNALTDGQGIEYAGYWQGLLRVSDAYFALSYLVFESYLMPRASGLSAPRDLARLTLKVASIMTLCTALAGGVFYAGRAVFIPLLYTDSFIVIEEIIIWHIVGDVFRIPVLAFIFLAFAREKHLLFFSIEALRAGIFLISLELFLANSGFAGVGYAYALGNGTVCLLVLILLVTPARNRIFRKRTGS